MFEFITFEWVKQNFVQAFVFGICLGFIVEGIRFILSHLYNRRFMGWQLLIKRPNEEDMVENLYWEDIKRFKYSKFEKWKFVKSTVSGNYWLYLNSIDEALNVWFFEDKRKRLITIDFTKMPEEHGYKIEKKKP